MSALSNNEKVALSARVALKGFDAMIETLRPLNDLTDTEKIEICSAGIEGAAAMVRKLNELWFTAAEE